MVWRPDCASVASARAMESRISLTPDSTAERAMKSALNASAINRAKVVLPTPGGPHRIIECGLPVANATASGLPGARRWRCPMTSPTVRGRNRSASGAAGLATVKRSASTQVPLSCHAVAAQLPLSCAQLPITSAPGGGANRKSAGSSAGLRSNLSKATRVSCPGERARMCRWKPVPHVPTWPQRLVGTSPCRCARRRRTPSVGRCRRLRPRSQTQSPAPLQQRPRLDTGTSRRFALARRYQNLAIAVGLHGRDHPGALHLLDQTRCPVVADAQMALHQRYRGPPRLQHYRHRLVIHRVGLRATRVDADAILAAAFGARFEDAVQILGTALRLKVFDHAVDFGVGDKRSVHALRVAGARRKVEHVALAKQRLGTHLLEDRPLFDLARHLDCNARRNTALDDPGYDVD